MLRIGLTGGIGSGKTAVSKIFAVLGIPVFYADAQAKCLMEQQPLMGSIKALFGEESYVNNQLNRGHIASIVFGDVKKLQQLNALVHPATIQAADTWMQLQHSPYVIKEAALLFEGGSAASFDYIIGVSAPQNLRIERVMLRDGISAEQVLARMSKQMPEDEKMARCSFVLMNDNTSLLIPQVVQLHKQFGVLANKTAAKNV